jgi:hypothetical protein
MALLALRELKARGRAADGRADGGEFAWARRVL